MPTYSNDRTTTAEHYIYYYVPVLLPEQIQMLCYSVACVISHDARAMYFASIFSHCFVFYSIFFLVLRIYFVRCCSMWSADMCICWDGKTKHMHSQWCACEIDCTTNAQHRRMELKCQQSSAHHTARWISIRWHGCSSQTWMSLVVWFVCARKRIEKGETIMDRTVVHGLQKNNNNLVFSSYLSILWFAEHYSRVPIWNSKMPNLNSSNFSLFAAVRGPEWKQWMRTQPVHNMGIRNIHRKYNWNTYFINNSPLTRRDCANAYHSAHDVAGCATHRHTLIADM